MKLYYKIMLVVSGGIIIVVGFITLFVYKQFRESIEAQMGSAAMDMSSTIAGMDEISKALAFKNKDGHIQEIIESLRENTRYQYIIIMDMDGIQYSYPYESGLYKSYKNGGEERVIENGEVYISADTNELISAIRSFYPIYYEGEQVGAVLVALLSDQIQKENERYRNNMEAALVMAVVVGIILAILLSVNIKNSIFGLEPKEIAMLLSEKELILHNIERGLIAIDTDGQVLLCNKRANILLNMCEEDSKPSLLKSSQIVYDKMMAVMACGVNKIHEQVILENQSNIILSMCMIQDSNNKIIGVVASMEDTTLIRALSEELTDYKSLVDTLRAQKHEFSNRLQTIAGLIQLGNHAEAMDYIEDVSKRNSQFQYLISECIRDNKIAGLLLSKYVIFEENKIEFIVDTKTKLTGLPKNITTDEVCTIIGNLLDNSMEVLLDQPKRIIKLYICSDDHEFILELYNSGPEIEATDAKRLFEKGYSTKGSARGYGLYLVHSIVEKVHGRINWKNDKGVKWYVRI